LPNVGSTAKNHSRDPISDPSIARKNHMIRFAPMRSESESMKNEPSYPKRRDVEIPLLKAICKLGGSVELSIRGREIEDLVGGELNLSKEQREFAAPNYKCEGNRKWRNELQFVRNTLADKGQIDSSRYDFWTVSVAGYKRVNLTPSPHAPNIQSTYRKTRGRNAQRLRKEAALDQI